MSHYSTLNTPEKTDRSDSTPNTPKDTDNVTETGEVNRETGEVLLTIVKLDIEFSRTFEAGGSSSRQTLPSRRTRNTPADRQVRRQVRVQPLLMFDML